MIIGINDESEWTKTVGLSMFESTILKKVWAMDVTRHLANVFVNAPASAFRNVQSVKRLQGLFFFGILKVPAKIDFVVAEIPSFISFHYFPETIFYR